VAHPTPSPRFAPEPNARCTKHDVHRRSTLAPALGPDAFDQLLRTYLERFRWRIATPADFQALAEELSGRDLDAMFNEWVYGE
jgi:hypothetical protein